MRCERGCIGNLNIKSYRALLSLNSLAQRRFLLRLLAPECSGPRSGFFLVNVHPRLGQAKGREIHGYILPTVSDESSPFEQQNKVLNLPTAGRRCLKNHVGHVCHLLNLLSLACSLPLASPRFLTTHPATAVRRANFCMRPAHWICTAIHNGLLHKRRRAQRQ